MLAGCGADDGLGYRLCFRPLGGPGGGGGAVKENKSERNPQLDDFLIPARKYLKLLIGKRYLLIYQIKNSTVYVDAAVDTRQDYGWLL